MQRGRGGASCGEASVAMRPATGVRPPDRRRYRKLPSPAVTVTQHTETPPRTAPGEGWPKSQSERRAARSTIPPMTAVTTPQEPRRQDPHHRERVTSHLLVAMSIVQFVLGF